MDSLNDKRRAAVRVIQTNRISILLLLCLSAAAAAFAFPLTKTVLCVLPPLFAGLIFWLWREAGFWAKCKLLVAPLALLLLAELLGFWIAFAGKSRIPFSRDVLLAFLLIFGGQGSASYAVLILLHWLLPRIRREIA